MRVFSGLLWAVVALLVALLAAFAWGRLRPPSPAQKAALEALQKDTRPAQGRNAYPAFWFAGFDVPADQLDAAYAKDKGRITAWYQSFDSAKDASAIPGPQTDFPHLPPLTLEEHKALCGVHDPDCLTKARAHDDALHALITKHARLLANDRALSHFDYAWDDMPKSPLGPMPPFNAATGLWQTAVALDFVDGRQAQAFDGACTQIATLRRLHAHSNSVVGTLMLAMRVRGTTMLFAQMLSEAPADLPLPSSCATAFAPLTVDDVDLCPSIQSEYASLAGAFAIGVARPWYEQWSFSPGLTKRMMAPGYAKACDATLAKKVLADDAVSITRPPPAFDLFDTVANSAGVVLSRIPLDNFDSLFARQKDMAATLRMGALLIWLRENHNDGRTVPQQLAARPAWLRFGKDRGVGVAPDGRDLTMKLRYNERNEWPTIWPLPTSP
jgi:hypothetical protein